MGAKKEKEISENIIIAGFGGQGVMFAGKLLAQSAMKAGLCVTWIPKYGAEVRGGTAHCMVRIASRQIASPLVAHPTSIIVLNKPSLIKFENLVEPGGVIIVNASLIDDGVQRNDLRTYYVPCSEIASDLGAVKGSNMVALGALVQEWGFLDVGIIKDAVKDILPSYRHKYIPLNQKALEEGAHFVHNIASAAPENS